MSGIYGESAIEQAARENRERCAKYYATVEECIRRQHAGELVKLVRGGPDDEWMIVPVPADQQWNPRYAAYARAHGKRPEEMHAFDKLPGRCHMYEFISWNNDHWAEFEKLHPEHFKFCPHICSDAGHIAYDAWLLEKYPIVS